MGILNDLRARVQSVADGLRTGEAVRNAVIRHGEDILPTYQRRQPLRQTHIQHGQQGS